MVFKRGEALHKISRFSYIKFQYFWFRGNVYKLNLQDFHNFMSHHSHHIISKLIPIHREY